MVDADTQVRHAAVRALRGIGSTREVLDLLGRGLGDMDPRVYDEAADQIAKAAVQHPAEVYEVVHRVLVFSPATPAWSWAPSRSPRSDPARAPAVVVTHLMTLATEMGRPLFGSRRSGGRRLSPTACLRRSSRRFCPGSPR